MNITPLEPFDIDAPKQPLAFICSTNVGIMQTCYTPDMRYPQNWEIEVTTTKKECEAVWQMLAGMSKITVNGKAIRKRYTVYTAESFRDIALTTNPRNWRTKTWKGTPVSITHDGRPTAKRPGVTVRHLGEIDDTLSPVEMMEDFRERVWSEGQDVTGSIGSMAYKLYRRTLIDEVNLWMDLPAYKLISENRHSARIGAKAGQYKDCEYHDIKTAFPYEMYSRPYPSATTWNHGHLIDDDTVAVLADVKITKGHEDWYPLPFHADKGFACSYGYCEDWERGLWTPREIQIALELGNKVKLIGTLQSTRTMEFGQPWWDQVNRLRSPGPGAQIGKVLTTALWGRFAMKNEESRLCRYKDDSADEIEDSESTLSPDKIQPGMAIAFTLTGRMRTRLWDEAIAKCHVVYCATDGVITQEGETPNPHGATPGQWMLKESLYQVIVKAPFTYAYRTPENKDYTEYVVAGASTRESQAAHFDRMPFGDHATCTAFGIFFPPMDIKGWRALLTRSAIPTEWRGISHYLSMLETWRGMLRFSPRRTNRIFSDNFGGIVNDRPIPIRPTVTEPTQLPLPLERV